MITIFQCLIFNFSVQILEFVSQKWSHCMWVWELTWLTKLQADMSTKWQFVNLLWKRDIFSDWNTQVHLLYLLLGWGNMESWNSNQKMEILRDDSTSLWKDLLYYQCLTTEDISVVTRWYVYSLSLLRPWCWWHCLNLDLWIFFCRFFCKVSFSH